MIYRQVGKKILRDLKNPAAVGNGTSCWWVSINKNKQDEQQQKKSCGKASVMIKNNLFSPWQKLFGYKSKILRFAKRNYAVEQSL